MFTNSPIFTTFSRQNRLLSGGWWLVMAPGLLLTAVALAILVWPELLAYMVAGVLLFAGVSLTTWAWALRRAERRVGERASVPYRIY